MYARGQMTPRGASSSAKSLALLELIRHVENLLCPKSRSISPWRKTLSRIPRTKDASCLRSGEEQHASRPSHNLWRPGHPSPKEPPRLTPFGQRKIFAYSTILGAAKGLDSGRRGHQVGHQNKSIRSSGCGRSGDAGIQVCR